MSITLLEFVMPAIEINMQDDDSPSSQASEKEPKTHNFTNPSN